MNIIITGSSGFIGGAAFKRLNNHDNIIYGVSRQISPTTTTPLDLTLPESYSHKVFSNFDVLVHSAAFTHVDAVEQDQTRGYIQNFEVTQNLAELAKERGAKFVYLSSDYVFPGEKTDGVYTEESQTRPVNFYGMTKLLAEEAIRRATSNHLILRTTGVLGPEARRKNFFMQMYDLNNPRKIPGDQVSNPTPISLLLSYISGGIERDLTGTYIATGPEAISRFDLAQRILRTCGKNSNLVTQILTSELGQAARRPLHCPTDSSKLRGLLSISPKTLDASLEEIFRECQTI